MAAMLLDPRDVGKAMARLRGLRTQSQVAEQGGLPPAQWSVYESGRRLPNPDTLAKILKGLGCTEDILHGETQKARARRLRGEEDLESAGRDLGLSLPEGGGADTQLVLTELRSLRAHMAMLSMTFLGLERRLDQLFAGLPPHGD